MIFAFLRFFSRPDFRFLLHLFCPRPHPCRHPRPRPHPRPRVGVIYMQIFPEMMFYCFGRRFIVLLADRMLGSLLVYVGDMREPEPEI